MTQSIAFPEEGVSALTVSDSNKIVVLHTYIKTLSSWLFNETTKKFELSSTYTAPESFAYRSLSRFQGDYIAAGATRGYISIFRLADMKEYTRISATQAVEDLTMSVDNKKLASIAFEDIQIQSFPFF